MLRRAVLLCLIGLTACAGGSDADDPYASLEGASQYRFHCGACHGKRGLGSKKLFPPLAQSELATGPDEVPIRIVLKGLEGPITVNDVDYLNVMPGLEERLSDAEIARILTFVRNAWGNRADTVSANRVAEVRASIRGRREPWKTVEILALAEELAAAGQSEPVREDP